MSDYERGFRDGWRTALNHFEETRRGFLNPHDALDYSRAVNNPEGPRLRQLKARKGRKQSGKAKILTAMTAPVWKKYKKGSGKKTYVQIRAQVSRSLAYKRKVKNL